MRLRNLVRKLKLGLAGLVGGFAFACSGPAPEAPPLAPRPEPMQPVPKEPDRKSPVPGAPDPLDPAKTGPTVPPRDAGITESSQKFESSHETVPVQATPGDAGVQDAVALPDEVPDALPPDANKRPESVSFACC